MPDSVLGLASDIKSLELNYGSFCFKFFSSIMDKTNDQKSTAIETIEKSAMKLSVFCFSDSGLKDLLLSLADKKAVFEMMLGAISRNESKQRELPRASRLEIALENFLDTKR